MQEGDVVPEFSLVDHTGAERSLTEMLADGPVALFFYPAAMTPGCTRESCHFRDLAAEFRAAGLSRVGISSDPVSKQREFAERYGFDYPLLSDEDGAVAEMFGVRRGRIGQRLGAPVKRSTFVIGTDRTVCKVIRNELNMAAHADEALAAVDSAA
jgi:peroxiredoxin Q/BCP